MESHDNRDFPDPVLVDQLREKADRMSESQAASITAGEPAGEAPLREWRHRGVVVQHRPDDEHGVLRMSVGGWAGLNCGYLVFRGKRSDCITVLQRALRALQAAP